MVLIRRHVRGVTIRPASYPWPIWTRDTSTNRIATKEN